MLKTLDETDLANLAHKLRPFVRTTPVQWIEARDLGLDGEPIALKLELLQTAGTAKMRAAHAFCLACDAGVERIVSVGSAEHNVAMSFAAVEHRLKLRAYVGTAAPFARVAQMRGQQADLIFSGKAPVLRRRAAKQWARTYGVPLYDGDRSQLARHGLATLADELDEQAVFDTLIVPVQSGAQLAGLAEWYQGRVKLVGVEAVRAPALFAARKMKRPQRVEVSGLTSERPTLRRVSPDVYNLASRYVSDVVVVSDAAIAEAQLLLWSQIRQAADAAGSLGLAALLSGAYIPQPNERVCILIPSAFVGPIDWALGS